LSLWDYAVEVYGRPGVEGALLELQDKFGQSVPLLLWAAWRRPHSRRDCDDAAEVSHLWERAVIGPLRMARRALKDALPGDTERREALRTRTAQLELDAEHMLLDALQNVGAAADDPLLKSLALAAAAWGKLPPPDRLAALAALLA
jgi:uncharacterized protein (TIGR02444 family)